MRDWLDLTGGMLITFFCFVFSSTALPQTQALDHDAGPKEKIVSADAKGPFDVKLSPQTLSEPSADPKLGRMSIEKQYHGDLEATAKGEMLTASTELKESGVYVAVERVTGTLGGRRGSFSMYHTGIMNRGKPELKIGVVPDSGTEELLGLTGTMVVKIDKGKHSYEFNYTLPEK
jgi:Protein of unknown function (DUF3224)